MKFTCSLTTHFSLLLAACGASRGPPIFPIPRSIFFRLGRAGLEVAAQVEVPCRNGLFPIGRLEKDITTN